MNLPVVKESLTTQLRFGARIVADTDGSDRRFDVVLPDGRTWLCAGAWVRAPGPAPFPTGDFETEAAALAALAIAPDPDPLSLIAP